MEVNAHNYVDLAVTTECTYGPVAVRLQEKTHLLRKLHFAIGLASELEEFQEALEYAEDDKNELAEAEVLVREELGDFFWYLAGLLNVLDKTLATVIGDALDEAFCWPRGSVKEPGAEFDVILNGLCVFVGRIADRVKKEVFYGKPEEDQVLYEQLMLLTRQLLFICQVTGINPNEVIQTNIDKLATRYPDKFTEGDALDRDKDAEMEALGG
jgi:NTP pyrophosphatase (non-canonical NTP hydrolase)